MTRRSVGKTVVHFYPKDVRDARGEEILGTLLDAGDASPTAFVRQLVSLAIAGVAARSRQALTATPITIAANTVCWMAIIATMRIPFGPGLRLLQAPVQIPPLTVLDTYLLPLAVLALFTLGRRRSTGMLGLAWVYMLMRENPYRSTVDVIELVVPLAAGFLLVTLRPRSAPTEWRYLWVIPAAVWGVLHLTVVASGLDALVLSDAGVLRAVLTVGAAVLFLPIAPALALGAALACSAPLLNVSLHAHPGTRLSLLAWTPVVLAMVAVGRRAAKRAYH